MNILKIHIIHITGLYVSLIYCKNAEYEDKFEFEKLDYHKNVLFDMDFSEGVLGRQYCNKVRKPRYAIRFVDFIGLYHAGYSIIKQQQIFYQYSFTSLFIST